MDVPEVLTGTYRYVLIHETSGVAHYVVSG
jgi:hypothetical protein